MARRYTLKQRAERQAETRRRIVEAAVDLHSTRGPARTPLAAVAERAGVQRHTLYAHFPDERSLFLACSGLALERDPLPDPAAWSGIADRRTRRAAGLAALYAWYERNAQMMACVLRDASYHDLTREMVELRTGPAMQAMFDTLADGLEASQVPMLRLALSYHSWATLARECGLSSVAAADAMAAAIESGGDP